MFAVFHVKPHNNKAKQSNYIHVPSLNYVQYGKNGTNGKSGKNRRGKEEGKGYSNH